MYVKTFLLHHLPKFRLLTVQCTNDNYPSIGGRAFAYQTETHFLPTSKTIVFLFQLSNATLRPFSSLSMSTCREFGILLQKCAI